MRTASRWSSLALLHLEVLALGLAARSSPALGAQPAFVDATARSGISFVQLYAPPLPGYLPTETARYGTGGAASDYDHDGDLDLFIVNTYENPSAFYRNEGGGAFVDITDELGLRTPGYGRTALFTDLDNDSFDDLIVLCDTNGSPEYPFSRIYRNDGDGTFTDVSAGSGFEPLAVVLGGATAGDYDHDGDLDVCVVTWYDSRSYLFRNEGNFRFTDVTASTIGLEEQLQQWTPLFVDLDGDGWQDLFCAVDFQEDYLFTNLANGRFGRRVPQEPFSWNNDMGVGAADFDDDGDIDLFTTNITGTPGDPDGCCNWLYVNDGTGELRNDAAARGVNDANWGWGAAFLDAELDGDLDLVVVSGWQQAEWITPPRLFVNDGTGQFTDQAASAGLERAANSRSLLPFDADRDGDIDLLVIDWEGPARFFENVTPRDGAHYLTVQLEGVTTNRNGVGARVYAAMPDRTKLVEITCGGSFSAGPPLEAHFGLGPTDRVDVTVVWPSGLTETLPGVAADQVLRVREPDAPPPPPPTSVGFVARPNPFRASTTVVVGAMGGAARVNVYDASGLWITSVPVEPDGTCRWDARDSRGRRVPSGVYLVERTGGRDHGAVRVVLAR